VAKEIELSDRMANMGAQMVKEVASKTSDVAGDGTTTATVLAPGHLQRGARLVAAGSNPMDIKRGIDAAVVKVVDSLKEQSKPTKGKSEIAQVGTISANGDSMIGDILAEAMEKVGKEGVVTVEESQVDGDHTRRGGGHAVRPRLPLALFRHRAERMEVVMEGRLDSHQREEDLEHEGSSACARAGAKGGKAAAHRVRGRGREALATLVVNKLRGTLHVCAVKAPGFAIAARKC